MSDDDAAAKELYEAKKQYHEAEGALAVATARLNRAEAVCRSIWTKRVNQTFDVPKPPRHYFETPETW